MMAASTAARRMPSWHTPRATHFHRLSLIQLTLLYFWHARHVGALACTCRDSVVLMQFSNLVESTALLWKFSMFSALDFSTMPLAADSPAGSSELSTLTPTSSMSPPAPPAPASVRDTPWPLRNGRPRKVYSAAGIAHLQALSLACSKRAAMPPNPAPFYKRRGPIITTNPQLLELLEPPVPYPPPPCDTYLNTHT